MIRLINIKLSSNLLKSSSRDKNHCVKTTQKKTKIKRTSFRGFFKGYHMVFVVLGSMGACCLADVSLSEAGVDSDVDEFGDMQVCQLN